MRQHCNAEGRMLAKIAGAVNDGWMAAKVVSGVAVRKTGGIAHKIDESARKGSLEK